MQMDLLLAYVNLLYHSISVFPFILFAIVGDASMYMGRILAAKKPRGMGGSVPQLENFARPCPPTKHIHFCPKRNK